MIKNLEKVIKYLKENIKRENYIFMRRRIAKGNGKKTLGWILHKENSSKQYENIDFHKLDEMKNNL